MINIKEIIDAMSYEEMLRIWRFEPSGCEILSGEMGLYFARVMDAKRLKVDYVSISKRVGWFP